MASHVRDVCQLTPGAQLLRARVVQPHHPAHPVAVRVCLPPSPKREPARSPDSTRIIPLPTGRLGVIFARDAEGKRPLAKVAATVAEAQAIVVAWRCGRCAQGGR